MASVAGRRPRKLCSLRKSAPQITVATEPNSNNVLTQPTGLKLKAVYPKTGALPAISPARSNSRRYKQRLIKDDLPCLKAGVVNNKTSRVSTTKVAKRGLVGAGCWIATFSKIGVIANHSAYCSAKSVSHCPFESRWPQFGRFL